MTPFVDAFEKLIDSFDISLRFEALPLTQAIGRVSYESHCAPFDSPAFVTAAMDGYAVFYEDQSLEELLVMGLVPAGAVPPIELERGKCIKIFTGAMMPVGATALVPIENVIVQGEKISITSPVKLGFAIRTIGEDYTKDTPLIPALTPLTFAHIGLLASWGKAMVKVVKPPVVSILATGSELLDLGEAPTNPSQIRSVNNMMLSALAIQSGAQAIHMGISGDDKQSISAMFQNAMVQSDIVVSTGGVSVGDFDFVKEIISQWPNAHVLIKGVNIKPGQHITVAKVGEKYFFGLPGFSASAAVTFGVFVTPIIRMFLGLPHTLCVEATFEDDVYEKRHQKTEFLASNLHIKEGQCIVTLEGKKQTTSANILSLLDPQSALIKIDETTKMLKKGDRVIVYPFPKGVV